MSFYLACLTSVNLTMDDDTDETVLFPAFVLLQNLQDKKTLPVPPRATPYRAPIAYMKLESWSIESAGWGG